jgi:hypothetical protein
MLTHEEVGPYEAELDRLLDYEEAVKDAWLTLGAAPAATKGR